MDIITACRELGLGVAITCGMFLCFFLLLKWVLQASDKQLDRMNEERNKSHDERLHSLKILDSFATAMTLHTEQAKEFHKTTMDDHKEMTVQLREITMVLGRINGYKEH